MVRGRQGSGSIPQVGSRGAWTDLVHRAQLGLVLVLMLDVGVPAVWTDGGSENCAQDCATGIAHSGPHPLVLAGEDLVEVGPGDGPELDPQGEHALILRCIIICLFICRFRLQHGGLWIPYRRVPRLIRAVLVRALVNVRA